MAKETVPNPLFTLRGDMEAIHSLHFYIVNGSEYLYASTQNGRVHKWNLKNCREENQVEIDKQACLAVKPLTNNMFICQLKGGEFKVYENSNNDWNLKRNIVSDYWGFCKIVINENFIICAESDSKVKILSMTGETIRTIKTNHNEKHGEVMALKCCSLKESVGVFVLFESGELTLFQVNGEEMCSLKLSSECLMALDFDGKSTGVVGGSGDIIFGFQLNLENRLHLVKWKELSITNPGVASVAIRPDRKLFAAGCRDTRIRLVSMKSFKLLAVLEGHKSAVQDVCFSPSTVTAWNCQYLLAAAGNDGRITLWNLYS